MKVSDTIKEIRKNIGYTQQALAEELFVAQNTLSQYENGIREIPTEIFLKIIQMGGFTMRNSNDSKVQKEKNIFAELKDKYPKFEVSYLAGGVWVMQGDTHSEKLGKKIMVAISKDVACVYKKLKTENGIVILDIDENGEYIFINQKEFEKEEDSYSDLYYDYEELSLVIVMKRQDEVIKPTEEGLRLFEDDSFKLIADVANNIIDLTY